MSDDDNLSTTLAAATCALLGVSAATPALADETQRWWFDTALLYYGEDDDRVPDVSAVIGAQRAFDDDRLLNLSLTADTLTAATLQRASVTLAREPTHWVGRFVAMASPCEVLVETAPEPLVRQLVEAAAGCAWRIERKFSRYRPGVLRKVWKFDGGSAIPTQAQIDAVMPSVGWHHVQWRTPMLQLKPGMQIDFGGDIAVRHPRRDGQRWRVGIEASEHAGTAVSLVNLHRGGLAKSGDSRRFVLHEGRRHSHVIDARTGWPVPDAPRSVTVAADTCTQAGTLTTLALLQGSHAERFLRTIRARYWIQQPHEETTRAYLGRGHDTGDYHSLDFRAQRTFRLSHSIRHGSRIGNLPRGLRNLNASILSEHVKVLGSRAAPTSDSASS